ncbi:hypothetical protein SUGI_1009830 [Cryptomeria japonica]|nr:hypothetical protein SUGI_1009830 [Cryptomeria japonica]
MLAQASNQIHYNQSLQGRHVAWRRREELVEAWNIKEMEEKISLATNKDAASNHVLCSYRNDDEDIWVSYGDKMADKNQEVEQQDTGQLLLSS